jgi:membrane protease YdiL (CAAX protease family)
MGLIIRILSHVILPVVAVALITKISLNESFMLPLRFQYKKQTIALGMLGAFGAVVIILSALLIFKSLIDFSAIAQSLNYELTLQTYILVASAIVLVNPFIEEYFWRGFVFRVFDKYWTGYWTGILFALHHAIIITGWFNWWQFLLILVFLSAIGILFNWMYKKTNSIYASWFTHAVADLIIVIIGGIYLL